MLEQVGERARLEGGGGGGRPWRQCPDVEQAQLRRRRRRRSHRLRGGKQGQVMIWGKKLSIMAYANMTQ